MAALYQAQAHIEAQRDIACGPGCAACCTDRVYLTSLEGELLLAELERLGRRDMVARAAARAGEFPSAPASTCNHLARCCLEQREPPAEVEAAGPWGACPLLEDGRCAAYQGRPLACRVMASRRSCASGGRAEGDPWWVTLDTALMQVAEHLSLGGVYGSLPAIVAHLSGEPAPGLLACEPLPGLPAPPEHQPGLQQALRPIFSQEVAGRPLGLWMDEIRRTL
jgi:Fe-S-cluster containining protein